VQATCSQRGLVEVFQSLDVLYIHTPLQLDGGRESRQTTDATDTTRADLGVEHQSPWLHDALLSFIAGMIGTLSDIRFWVPFPTNRHASLDGGHWPCTLQIIRVNDYAVVMVNKCRRPMCVRFVRPSDISRVCRSQRYRSTIPVARRASTEPFLPQALRTVGV
jgi:hypothetical protein